MTTRDARPSFVSRLLAPIAEIRPGEGATALLLFLYSFLAMTSYNIVKPVTRSQFISSLGADNLPWVQFGAGMVIGLLMQGYTRLIATVPRRWTIPVTQAGMITLLVLFWVLFTRVGAEWVSVGFYLFGLVLGILLISQFWTLANDIYDPRQAKRLFGLIGGGASLGGATGAAITAGLVEELGTTTMLLVSAAIMAICAGIVVRIIRTNERAGQSDAAKTGEDEGVGGGEALALLRGSRHLQIIALVITFAAIGAAIIEQQLNMATAEAKGQANTDGITAFLAQVTVYLSLIGLFIQVAVTSRIHRLLGIGFALLILPVSLGASGLLMLTVGALWTSGVARVLDTSLRYTVDKTTREILFLPLPADVKYRAKPFIDVTVDRLSKGAGALLILVLIKDWGLGLTWQQLSYASLSIMALWVFFALRARKEYMAAFRKSIVQQDMKAGEIRLETADLSTIEALVEELAHPDPKRVVYALDLLESLDKRHLVSPLMLHHEHPDVRTRVLTLAEATGPSGRDRWLRGIERALADAEGEVRGAAVRALAAVKGEEAATLMRPYLRESDPALVVTAASALSNSTDPADVSAAISAFRGLIDDSRDQRASTRAEAARALGRVTNPQFRPLLVPLMFDADTDVARAAIRSAARLGAGDFLFVPPLVSLLRNRRLKGAARDVLAGYGEAVVPTLVYFMRDRDEDVWVRRHMPATLARIPCDASVHALVGALEDPDGFLRYKALSALEHLRRVRPDLTVPAETLTRLIAAETARAFDRLTLHYNLFHAGGLDQDCLLARALTEKYERAFNRLFTLLSLVHPPADIAAVRHALLHGDARGRSNAAEFLDNILKGEARPRVMLLAEDMPLDVRIAKGNAMFRTRGRDVEDTLAQLVHDESQEVSATAVQLVEARGLWALAGDLEHLLQHRPAHDWWVFEAASWALAAQRMPASERRVLWQEPLPAMELADRLRRVPLFHFVSVDELFRVASLGRQVRHEAGRTIAQEGAPIDHLHFILDGRVSSVSSEGEAATLEAPSVIGFEETLEGHPVRATAKALEPTITLTMTTDEFLTLVSENVEIAQGIFRMLIETRCAPSWRTVVKGELAPELARRVTDGVQAVDGLLLLQASPLLQRATTTELVHLAGIARVAPLAAGASVFKAGDDTGILAVVAGAVAITAADGAVDTATPGDVVGMYEALGGRDMRSSAAVKDAGAALVIERADLFELLADHTPLLQGIFSGLLHAARRAAGRSASARREAAPAAAGAAPVA
ncbi:MAG: Npt1/Npt2 family nucleotide transporter [Vicinamibacterales bacterium]